MRPNPPKHAFEVTLRIGANDWPYVLHTMQEMTDHLEQHGPECNLASGGWDGSHSVEISRRDISPDDYRKELDEWANLPDTEGEQV